MSTSNKSSSRSRIARGTALASIALALAALSPNASGFSPSLASFPRTTVPLRSMSMENDSPSDTPLENDDVVTVDVESAESLETVDKALGSESETPGALVSRIVDLLPSTFGLSPSEENRSAINEALLGLEALNPTPEPATSALLNGVWELAYAGLYSSAGALDSPTRQAALFLYSGGYSPGLFCLQLAKQLPRGLVEVTGPLDISISRAAPRVEASVSVKTLLGGTSTVRVKSDLGVVSGVRLKETYESAEVLGRGFVDLPGVLQYSREIYVTYLDEDLMIVRDGSGVPELLVRKEKSFTRVWGDEPTTVDDELAPGEEDADEASVL